MSISLHDASVGVYIPFLKNISGLLDHGAAYAVAQNVDPAAVLALRLAPNMYSLQQQVEEANRHVILSCALLADRDPISFSKNEVNIPELKARISATVDFAQRLPRETIDKAGAKRVIFTFKNGATRSFTGKELLLTFSVPQFFFHVTTAYDILRHAGVVIAKKDFLGPPRLPNV